MSKTAVTTETNIVRLVDMLAAAQMREKALVEALKVYASADKWRAIGGRTQKRVLICDEDGYLVAQRALKEIS